ncbi:MAG: hypothetical protein V3U60_06935 [Gammaproteobacteria bacterium]
MQRWHGLHVFDRIQAKSGLEVQPPTTDYFIDTTNGSDNNAGKGSWELAFATIQAGFDAVNTLATRGRARIFVAPGGYTETLTLPTNANGPFGQLIAWQPTENRVSGAVFLAAAAAADILITVRARGWLIDGFEIGLGAGTGGGAGIRLDKKTSGANADYTTIKNCHFSGGQNSRMGIDFRNNVLYAQILNCLFNGIHNTSDDGEAIGSSNSDTSVSSNQVIRGCKFQGNNKHISFNGNRGPNDALIEDCLLLDDTNKTATKYVDLSSGTVGYNVVRRNVFDGTYSIAGGYESAQATDIWVENFGQATMAVLTALPA